MAGNALNWQTAFTSRSWIPLFALTAIYAIGLSVFSFHNLAVPEGIALLGRFEFSLILTWWVRADRLARRFSVPFEFDAFVFFAWPIFATYYLYKTRRRRGLLLAAGIFGLFIAPGTVAQLLLIPLGR